MAEKTPSPGSRPPASEVAGLGPESRPLPRWISQPPARRPSRRRASLCSGMAWLLRYHDAWALRPLLLLGAFSTAALAPCKRGLSAATLTAGRLAAAPGRFFNRVGRSLAGCGGSTLGVDDLPPEVLYEVFSRLDCRSLLLASCACRRWRAAALSDELWRGLVRLEFGDEAARRCGRPTWRAWLASLATSPDFAHHALVERFRASLGAVAYWKLVVEPGGLAGGGEPRSWFPRARRGKVAAHCDSDDALLAPQGVILGFVLSDFNEADARPWNLSVVAACRAPETGATRGVVAWSRRLFTFPGDARGDGDEELVGMYPDLTVGRVGSAFSVTVRLHYRDVLAACRDVVPTPQTLPLGGWASGRGQLQTMLLHVDVSTLTFDGSLALRKVEHSVSHRTRLRACDKTDKSVIFAGVLPGPCLGGLAPEEGPRSSVFLDMAVFGLEGRLALGLSGVQLAIIDCGREGEHVAIAFHIANAEAADVLGERPLAARWGDESKLMMRTLKQGPGLVTLFYLKFSNEMCRMLGRKLGLDPALDVASLGDGSEQGFETDWSRLLIRTL